MKTFTTPNAPTTRLERAEYALVAFVDAVRAAGVARVAKEWPDLFRAYRKSVATLSIAEDAHGGR